jgi:serine/threonine protein kinase/Flp pilus assembly protein TadD
MTLPLPDEAAVFNAARLLETLEDRRRYLEKACAGDQDLQARVEALLRVHAEEPTFLEQPAEGVQPLPVPTFEGPGAHIGPYRLVKPLGEGGMGSVFLAEQKEPVRRQVALKLIRPGLDGRQVLARFEAERQALALMDHPHIARVFDAGTTDSGRPYFVMELVQGLPLTRYCDEHRLSLRRRLELLILICHAVQHAHQKGIIHRDLKPSNILVAEHDGRPMPKVIDFGVAKATEQRLTEETLWTETGQVVGTLEYMSPEQADPGQADIDTRSDIYALGALLYELLTGSTPLGRLRRQGAPLWELLRMIREEEAVPPSTRLSATEELPAIAARRSVEISQLRRVLRGDVDWIVMKCLEKERSRRYESASALARDLERYLADEPVEARPPSTGYRMRKLARKHRKALAVALAFALLLVGGTALSTWQAVRATVAERAVSAERDRAVAEKERADEQAAVAEAVNRFLNEDLLAQATPGKTRDRDIKLRTVLDRAAERIGGRFPAQPVVEARVRRTLAHAYWELGEFDEAERHGARALELYRATVGPDDPRTISALGLMASIARGHSHLEEACKLHAEVLQARRRVLGPEHRDTLETMNNLGVVLCELRSLDEARKLHEEALEIRRRRFGPDDPDALTSMANLAVVLSAQGHAKEALTLAEEVLERRRKVLGRDHAATLISMMNVGLDLWALDRAEEASRVLQEVIPLQQKVFGPAHPMTLSSMGGLAQTLYALGRRKEARKLYEELLQLQRRVLSPKHTDRLTATNDLAGILATSDEPGVRDPVRALALAQEVIEYAPKNAAFWNTLGIAQYRCGDCKAAIASLEKSEALAPDRYVAANGYFLALAHWQLGHKDVSRQWYDKAARWAEQHGPTDYDLLQIQAEAAKVLGVKE